MQALTNQSLYTELVVIPPKKMEESPIFRVAQKAILFLSITFLTVSLGVALSLAEIGVSISGGVLGGWLIGSIFGSIVGYYTDFPSPAVGYRKEVLDKIQSILVKPRALSAIKTLKSFFSYPFTGFKEYFHLHALQSELCVVGDAIDSDRLDAVKIWKEFLTHLHQIPLKTPGGETIQFDSSFLLDRMNGLKKQINREKLGFSWFSSPSPKDFMQIEQIAKLSFGMDAISPQIRIQKLKSYLPSGLQIVRDEKSKDILGYGFFYTENGVVQIEEIARVPEASRLNIGVSLLYDILNSLNPSQTVQICLRKSNPFRLRLEKFGFFVNQELPNHYSKFPKENGLMMQLNWQKYYEFIAQLV